MKKFKWFFLLILLCLFAGSFFSMNRHFTSFSTELDMLAVNRLEHLVADNWEHLDDLSGLEQSYDFIVLDRKGNCLFRSREDLPATATNATKAAMVSWDVMRQDSVIGTIMIETQSTNLLKEISHSYQMIISISFIAVAGIALVIFFYLYHRIIRPFEKLQSFTVRIASGDIDKPFPMDRHNLFGSFIESFDLMRTSLKQAQMEALALDKSKKELIASLTHDIKTPLTSINLTLEVLNVKYQDNQDLQAKLDSVKSKTTQIEQLTTNLLHSTLEDLDELTVTPVSQDSKRLKELLAQLNTQNSLFYSFVPACLIDIDLIRVEQVLDNIISNSRKYGSPPLRISFTLEPQYLHMQLEDNGDSINSDELELLCNKYYRGTNAIASGKEGEGIGLYLARKMMRGMNGDLEPYCSNPGFGIHLLFKLS